MIPCGESTVSNMQINWNSKENEEDDCTWLQSSFFDKNAVLCYLSNKSNISLTNSHNR